MEVMEPSGRYLVKAGAQRTELGAIPEDWVVTDIGVLAAKVGSGKTPSGGSSRYVASGRPFMRSQNVGWGRLLLEDLVFIDEQTHLEFDSTEVCDGDVLLNITGASIGRSAIADRRLIGGNVNQHVCIIRVDRPTNRLLCSIVLSSLGQKQIDSFQAGGNREGLNFRQVRSISLAIPRSLDEQEAIADTLSDADALIESLEQLLAKKRQIKQGAMQELLTGQRRLPGFADEWSARRFDEIVDLRKERIDPRQSEARDFCVELEHLESGTGCLSGFSATTEDSSLKSIFREGDVLFGKLRAYLRKFWLANRQGVCSTEIWVLIAKRAILLPSFLFQLVMDDKFIDAASTAYGTHMPRSDWSVVRNHRVSLPGLAEQTAIATTLSDMDAEITALLARLAKARQLKQGMMQALLTGRIRLVPPQEEQG
jgi:type I restriction enzyme, S subunit